MKTSYNLHIVLLIAASAALFTHCGTSVYYVKPPDWQDQFKRDSAVAAFSDALKGVTIFVDPGHGGEDRASMGPAKEVVEADVNLRVALKLRDYLKRAGANVILSRETDVSLPPAARAQQANANNAEIFVSIHHNATDNPYTNYTSTFYHGRQGEMGYKPSSHDLARYIQRDLAYVMGNPGSLASFDGTISDYKIYANEGFAVLRETKMTAVLIECAFFTSAYEEQRLKIPEFNDIEAWGIFRGIAKYIKAGIPTLRYVSPPVFKEVRPKLEIQVSDRADINDESIRVYIDGKEEGFSFNAKTGKITLSPADELTNGYHILSAQVRNNNENSSSPFQMYFGIGNPPATLRYSADPAVCPPDESAFSIITISALDTAGVLIPDPIPIRFKNSIGIDTLFTLHGGLVKIYLYPGGREKVTFEASNGPVKTEGAITTSAEVLYSRGLVMSADGKPVVNAVVDVPGSKPVATSMNGEYIISGINTAGMEVSIKAPGFFGKREALNKSSVQDPILLLPVANAVLHSKTVVLDMPVPVAAQASPRLDTAVIAHLAELLRASGAIVLATSETAKTKKARQELLAANREATIIQFYEQAKSTKISIRVNGVAASKKFGEAIFKMLPQFTGVGIQPTVLRMMPNEELEKARQVSISLPVSGAKSYDERLKPLVAWNTAWAVYNSLLTQEGYKLKGSKIIEVTVIDREKNAPAAFVTVELNLALRAMTDAKGVCRFRAVTVSEDDVRVADPEKYEISGVKTDIVD